MASLTLSLSLVSCEDEIENTEAPLVAKSEEGSDKDKCDFEPHGVFFDNGHTVNCDNNMMHFPNWESFANTVEQLEIDVDNHDDSFLNTYGNLNEDDLNDLEESMGHNPDLPLKAFEEHHSFCSLRQTEAAAEEAWLDASDQPGWSMDDWQENRFIADAVEQALYNPYNEIMICNLID
jgi:hypothetical protein